MTITKTTNRWSYTGDGTTTVFTYENKIFVDTDLKVYIDGVLKTITTDYTVSGVGEVTGGNVTFVTAPANAEAIVIVRDVPDTQPSKLPRGGPMPTGTIEDELDRRTVLSQQKNDLLQNRTLRLADGDTPVTLNALPVLADRASKYLAFDAASQPIASAPPEGGNVVSAFMATVLDDTTAAAARTTLGAGVGDAVKADQATWSKTQTWSKGADVASAATLTLGTDGNVFDVTGTVTITSIATLGVGSWVMLQFDGAVLLTHHATNLVLPGGANYTTAAGDIFLLYEYATGDWRVAAYALASGKPLVSIVATDTLVGGLEIATQAEQETGTALDKMVVSGRQHYHPAHPKALIKATAAATPAIDASVGVSSLDDDGTGNYGINWTTAFSTVDYYLTQGVLLSSATSKQITVQFDTQAVGSVDLQILDTNNAATETNVDNWFVAAFGDQ